MKLSLSDSLRHFFKEHQILELESLFSSQEIDLLLQELEALQGKKTQEATDSWILRKDSWKHDEEIKKWISSCRIGEIAAFLYQKRPIRLAYTAFLSPMQTPTFTKPLSLSEISSADPILGGALICLTGETSTPLSLPHLTKQTKGSVLFFSSDHPIPFPELFATPEQKSLLLCFIPGQARYKLQPLDPCTHVLKKFGYAFGDLLLEAEAPYLYH